MAAAGGIGFHAQHLPLDTSSPPAGTDSCAVALFFFAFFFPSCMHVLFLIIFRPPHVNSQNSPPPCPSRRRRRTSLPGSPPIRMRSAFETGTQAKNGWLIDDELLACGWIRRSAYLLPVPLSVFMSPFFFANIKSFIVLPRHLLMFAGATRRHISTTFSCIVCVGWLPNDTHIPTPPLPLPSRRLQ